MTTIHQSHQLSLETLVQLNSNKIKLTIEIVKIQKCSLQIRFINNLSQYRKKEYTLN